jgi:hypothetical protein
VLAALRELAVQELEVEQELHPACVASPGRLTTLLIGSDIIDFSPNYIRQVPHQFHYSLSAHFYRQHYSRSLQAVTHLGGTACVLKALAALVVAGAGKSTIAGALREAAGSYSSHFARFMETGSSRPA